jgi:hypothetical protein
MIVAQAIQPSTFPLVVIELPKDSYHLQSKTAMRVAPKNMGGISYEGPSRMFPTRWKHISVFYIIELAVESYYLAQSLSHHPHYTVLRAEFPTFDSLLSSF